MPDLPTIAEAACRARHQRLVLGGVAAGTPRLIIDKLNGVADAVLKRPDVQDRLNALAITPLTSTPEELEKIHPGRDRKVGEGRQGRRHRAAVTLVRA